MFIVSIKPPREPCVREFETYEQALEFVKWAKSVYPKETPLFYIAEVVTKWAE